MDNKNISEETTVNGFFTKIVSLMFICSVFTTGVDASSAQVRADTGIPQEKAAVTGEAYLESNILSSSGSIAVFGNTIPGARLQVKHPSGNTYQTIADTTGHFKLKGLPLMTKGDMIDIVASVQDLKISEHLCYNR